MSGAPVARLPIGRRIRKTVPATTTLAVDTVITAKYRDLRYHLTSWRTGGSSKGLDMRVHNDDGVVSDTVYARIGSLPMSVGASISGSDTILEVTNPNGFDIEVELIRFKIGEA